MFAAGNESCPQPQTSEHLAAIEIMKLKHILILQNKIDLVKEGQAKEQYEQILKFVQGKQWHQCYLFYESWCFCSVDIEDAVDTVFFCCWVAGLLVPDALKVVLASSSRVHQNHNPGDQSTFRLASFSVNMKPYHCLTFFIHWMFFSCGYLTAHCLFVTFPIHLLMQLPVTVICKIWGMGKYEL